MDVRYFVVTLYKIDGTEEKVTVEYTWELEPLYRRFISSRDVVSIAVHKRS